MMTARAKILLLIGVLLAFSILTVSIVGYLNFKSASNYHNGAYTKEQAFLISKALDEKMNRYFDTLEVTTDTIEIDKSGLLDIDKTLLMLDSLTNKLGVLDAFITTKNAKTYAYGYKGLNPNFNAREKKREWFLRPMSGAKRVITTPYKSTLGPDVMSLAVPIRRNGEIVGVLCLKINITQITNFINKLNPKNQLFVSREDGYIMAAKDKAMIGKNLYDIRPSYKKYQNDITSYHNYQLDGKSYSVTSQQSAEFG